MALINLARSAVEAIKNWLYKDGLSVFPDILMMHSDKWGFNIISFFHLSFNSDTELSFITGPLSNEDLLMKN